MRIRVDETARILSFYYSFNVSREGIFLETKVPLEVGTRVFLEFTFPDGGKKIKAWSRVVWVKKPSPAAEASEKSGVKNTEPPGMGLIFEGLLSEDVSRIAQYIEGNDA